MNFESNLIDLFYLTRFKNLYIQVIQTGEANEGKKLKTLF